MTSGSSRRFLTALTFWLLTAPTTAVAQDAATVAEGLFREGVELLRSGAVDEACAKLGESQRLDPSSGTLLNLADCHEKQGKTATAWAEFLAASRLAASQGRPERADEAKRRAQLLEPKLAYLKVVLSEKAPGTTVTLDSVTLEASALGSKIPVDPGKRTVVVAAPGYEPVTLTVTITERDAQTLTVPRLQREPATTPSGTKAPAPAEPATKPGAGTSPPIAGYVIGGVGVVALGAGGVFALLARSAYQDAEAQCPTRTACSPSAMKVRDKAETRANIANVGVGVGVAAVAVGTVLILTHSSSDSGARSPRRSVRLSPLLGPTNAGLQLDGVVF